MNDNIDSAWAAIVPVLRKFRNFHDIKDIFRLTGFDLKILNGLGISEGGRSNDYEGFLDANKLIEQIEAHFIDFSDDKKTKFLNIVIEEILSEKYDHDRDYYGDLEQTLQYNLNRLGWELIDKRLLPIDVLDSSELEELDPAAREDLIKAVTKFRDGDLSGAISSACAAVDSVTERVYQDKNLGEASKSQSFKERCDKSLKAVRVLEAIDSQLSDIKWIESDINQFKGNLKNTVSQAAFVMQTLRSNMSDVHGTKPVIKPLVFDSIKWAQIIVRLLSEKYDN